MREELRGRWSGEQVYEHPFVRTVITTMIRAYGNKTTLEKWIKEITSGFVSKNCLALPVKMCLNQPGIVIDTRSLVEIVKGMSTQWVLVYW